MHQLIAERLTVRSISCTRSPSTLRPSQRPSFWPLSAFCFKARLAARSASTPSTADGTVEADSQAQSVCTSNGPIRIVTEHRSSVHHSIPVCQTSFARCRPCEVTSASAAYPTAPTPPCPKLLAFCHHATRSPNDRDQGLIGVSRRPMRW